MTVWREQENGIPDPGQENHLPRSKRLSGILKISDRAVIEENAEKDLEELMFSEPLVL